MNTATRFYNTINVTYGDSDLFSSCLKEFDPLIRNYMSLPAQKFVSAIFNDNSGLTTLNGTTYVTNSKEEFMDCICTLMKECPELQNGLNEILT